MEDENESKKKGKRSGASSSAKEEASPKPAEAPTANGGAIVINAQSAATLGAVAVLAAGVGFLAAGSRR